MVWVGNKKDCETMKVNSTRDMIKGRELSYKMKQGLRAVSMLPGFEKALDSIFAEINIALQDFEKETGREPDKAEAETITKTVMARRFPELEKIMKALKQPGKAGKLKDLLLMYIKAGMKPKAPDKSPPTLG